MTQKRCQREETKQDMTNKGINHNVDRYRATLAILVAVAQSYQLLSINEAMPSESLYLCCASSVGIVDYLL